jgi:uncharacterized protein YegL
VYHVTTQSHRPMSVSMSIASARHGIRSRRPKNAEVTGVVMMEPTGERLTPLYLVVDVSWSMSTHGKLEAANQMIGALAEALRRNPAAARRVRVGIIDFSQDAHVRLPLSDLTAEGVELPRLQVRDGTNFSSAFTAVRQQIDTDTRRSPPGDRFGPPLVFFVSDGGPTDDESDWRTAFGTLIAHESRPAVVPCGIDEAEAHLMGSLIHPQTGPARTALFMMADGASVSGAVTGVGQVLITSVLRTDPLDGRPALPRHPDLPAGVLRYEPEQFG